MLAMGQKLNVSIVGTIQKVAAGGKGRPTSEHPE